MDGYFSGHMNGHSCVMVGPRGSGKTVALRRLALVAPVLFPGLRVVYVSAKRTSDTPHPLRGGLCRLLLSLGLCGATDVSGVSAGGAGCVGALELGLEATARGNGGVDLIGRGGAGAELHGGGCRVSGGGPESGTCASGVPASDLDSLIALLRRERLWLLVAVDDLQALFERGEEHAYAVLQELEALTDVGEGRTALVGCSSSSFLAPLLCSGAGLPASLRRAHFPLACKYALSDMNAQKLAMRHMPSASPTDATQVAAFCGEGSGGTTTGRTASPASRWAIM
jgi:hypothetical protein